MDAKASRLGVTPLSPVTYSSSWNSASFSVTLPKRLLRAFTRYLICSSWKSAKLLQRTSHTPTITQVGRHRTKATPLWSRVPAHTAPPARTPARLASAGSASSGLFVRWSVPNLPQGPFNPDGNWWEKQCHRGVESIPPDPSARAQSQVLTLSIYVT